MIEKNLTVKFICSLKYGRCRVSVDKYFSTQVYVVVSHQMCLKDASKAYHLHMFAKKRAKL